MPQVGEIRKGNKRPLNNRGSCVWHACIDCGKTRWVLRIYGQPRNTRCRKCSRKQFGLSERGSNHPSWRGGRSPTSDEYMAVYIPRDDFFFPMAGKTYKYGGYVLEHRLIYAKFLGRLLNSWEIVHHKNGKRQDNRLENLELTTRGKHGKAYGDAYQDGYRQGYADAKAELRSFS